MCAHSPVHFSGRTEALPDRLPPDKQGPSPVSVPIPVPASSPVPASQSVPSRVVVCVDRKLWGKSAYLNVSRIMVKSTNFPSSGTTSEVGGMISASSKKNTVNDSRMDMLNDTLNEKKREETEQEKEKMVRLGNETRRYEKEM